MNRRSALAFGSLLALTTSAFAIPATDAPRRMPYPEFAAASANNSLAWKLYEQVKAGNDNVMFSPFSLSTALSMVWAGADGETAKQMATVVGTSRQEESWHHAGVTRLASLLSAYKDVDINVANKVWAQTGFPFEKAFMDLASKRYRSAIAGFDFKANHATAHKIINAWVGKQTRGKLKELFNKGDIIARTRMVVANAIYFKGGWKLKFDKKHTRKRDFWVAGTTAQPVDMMHGRRNRLRYQKRNGYSLLELPYKGGQLSMVIALPDSPTGLAAMEKRLPPEGLRANSWAQQVNVALPKFTFSDRTSLAKQLSTMGMPLAFDKSKADFSRLSRERLYIHKVVHKAFIEVNEKGTEAAAATGISIVSPTSARPPTKPVNFTVDRPFVFGIRDVRTNALVFLGRVTDPRK